MSEDKTFIRSKGPFVERCDHDYMEWRGYCRDYDRFWEVGGVKMTHLWVGAGITFGTVCLVLLLLAFLIAAPGWFAITFGFIAFCFVVPYLYLSGGIKITVGRKE